MSGEPLRGDYRVSVEKRHGFWIVLVRDLGVTHAQSPMEMEPLARDLVASMTAAEPADIRLTWSLLVRVERSDGGWKMHVGDIGVTYCETLASAEWDVQEYVETVLEYQPAATDLTWDLSATGRADLASPAVAAEVGSFVDRCGLTRLDRE